MKPTLYDIVDTHVYITSNCFQHQLSETLQEEFDVKRIQLSELSQAQIPNDALVISRLKLRTLFNNLDVVSPVVKNTRLFVYEQDTWENFLVESPYFGSYKKICDKLPVISFLNMSHFWSELVETCGMPSSFVQVWMLPKYCTDVIPWAERKHDVIFCGTLYEERKAFIHSLRNEGVNIEVIPAGLNYQAYLELLSNSRIAIRSELKNWKISVNDKRYTVIRPNAQWQRDVECAARGCISMREHDDEAKLWNIDKMSTIMPFTDVKNAVELINTMLKMSNDYHDMRAKKSSNYVKNSRGWKTVADVIRTKGCVPQ